LRLTGYERRRGDKVIVGGEKCSFNAQTLWGNLPGGGDRNNSVSVPKTGGCPGVAGGTSKRKEKRRTVPTHINANFV